MVRSVELENRSTGSVEAITGCMFSGKTDEMIRRLRKIKYAKVKIQAFKPEIDKRRGVNSLNTEDGINYDAISIRESLEILALLEPDTKVVGIDEAQFFDDRLPDVCHELAARGIRVIVAGLDTNFKGEPFGVVPRLMAEADVVDKKTAICVVCGEAAIRTQRIKIIEGERIPANYEDPVVLVGAAEAYEARCREHHEVPGAPERVRI